MGDRNCGVCNKEVPLDHEQLGRRESDGSITPYHMNCERRVRIIKPCEDCGQHKIFCNECKE